MSTISTTIQLYDNITSPINNIISALERTIDCCEEVGRASNAAFDSSRLESARAAISQAALETERFSESVHDSGRRIDDNSTKADKLTSSIKNMVAAYASVKTAEKIISFSDELTQTTARLNMINDGQRTTEELQDAILASAQRSRAEYTSTADVVAKLALRAGDVFNSNSETIAFAENLNKLFVIAGASQEEMKSASLQLTQALGSGVLRGEELNAVFEAAPNVIQTIADYMNVPMGSIREMASEGQITGEIVKNAILSAAEDINSQFEQMPYTWAQVWTYAQNIALDTFEPLLQAIGSGAQFIYDNWSVIEPVIVGIGAGVLTAAGAWGIYTAVTWLAVSANQALVVSMMTNPILLIGVAVAFVVTAIYKWVQACGGIRVALLKTGNIARDIANTLKIIFFTAIYSVMDCFDQLGLKISTVGYKIPVYISDMSLKSLQILESFINGVVDDINKLIGFVNKIPGVNIEAVGHIDLTASAALENEAVKARVQATIDDKTAVVDANMAQRQIDLSRMTMDARIAKAYREREIAEAQADSVKADSAFEFPQIPAIEDIAANTGDIAGNTKSSSESSNEMKEELAYLRDIAERDIINRFTTDNFKFEFTNNNNGERNIDGVIDRFAEELREYLDTGGEGAPELV